MAVRGSGHSRGRVSEERIREFLKLSPTERWRSVHLVEEFVEAVAPPRAKRIRDMFRRGEL